MRQPTWGGKDWKPLNVKSSHHELDFGFGLEAFLEREVLERREFIVGYYIQLRYKYFNVVI